jgi:hypothetical protein
MAATTSTAPMVAADTQRLLASQRQKNFTNGLSWKMTNLKLSRVGMGDPVHGAEEVRPRGDGEARRCSRSETASTA